VDTAQINHLSFCAGYGGIDLALKSVVPDGRTIAYVEIEASQSRTWLGRWKRENWIKHLCGRTLRLSQRKSFTDWWTSSLEATRANRSVPPVNDEEPKTQDISGRFCAEQFDLFGQDGCFWKTSKDTSRLDSPRSSAIWTMMVIEQRGEYLVRRNAARLINANESLSWPTPDASVEKFRLGGNSQQSRSLEAMGRRGELSPQDPANHSSTGKNPERLSPNWTEQLMGVPVGWTQLPIEWTGCDSSETALSRQPQQKRGQS